MSTEPDSKKPTKIDLHKQSRFPWASLFLSVVVIAVAAFAYNAYVGIAQAAEKFMTGTITHTFREHIPEVTQTHGDVLELTTSRSEESFTRTDSKKIFWDWVYLGTTVSEIRVTATFRYTIRLSDTWRLAAKDQVCLVLAPPIHPSLPTAIDTGSMEKSTTSGWARFNKDDNLTQLEKGVTSELDQRAGDLEHMKFVRELCRQSVADFVKKWLMKEEHWRSDRFSSIVVAFPDEATFNSDQELEQYRYKPTVKLD